MTDEYELSGAQRAPNCWKGAAKYEEDGPLVVFTGEQQ